MKKLKIFFFFAMVAVVAGFVYQDQIKEYFGDFSGEFTQLEKLGQDLLMPASEKGVSSPPPLHAEEEVEDSFLTVAGTYEWTNKTRVDGGIGELFLNKDLSVAAAKKAEDMLERQYFAHQSPNGKDASDLAGESGYSFISIGENLAMGNFVDDEALVQAWMNSPGHRENILNPSYGDIGVAVLRGEYEGKLTWMAVQIFGRPTSDCNRPNQDLAERIDANESKINNIRTEIDDLKNELENKSNENKDGYNSKVKQHNELVKQHNELIKETKLLVDQYNIEVAVYNKCLSE